MPEKMTFGGDSRPCHFSSVATSTELYAQDTFAIQYIFEKYARKSELGKGLQVGNRKAICKKCKCRRWSHALEIRYRKVTGKK